MATQKSDLAKLEGDIAALANDNSQEGIAERMKLEAEAAAIKKKIGEDEQDRSISEQKKYWKIRKNLCKMNMI